MRRRIPRRPRAALHRNRGRPSRRPLGLHIIRDFDRAYSLLHPVRRRILEIAKVPRSSAEIAHELKLERQKVNYHVKDMARARLLIPAGRKSKRRFYEQRYVASAKAYVLSPELLGKLGADAGVTPDRFSAAYLMGLSAQMQKEIARALDLAMRAGKKVATLSVNTEVRFTSVEQRAEFTRALERAIGSVLRRHTSPHKLADGSPAQGWAFRLVLGCYPIASKKEEEDWREKGDPAGEKAGWKDLALPLP